MGLITKRMKFFFIPITNYRAEYSADLYDVPDIPGPYYLLFDLYSKPHSPLPRNAEPNNASLVQEIRVEANENSSLSASLQTYLCSRMEDILYEDVRDLCSLLLLEYEHSLHYKSESVDRDSEPVYPPSIRDSDISLSKLNAHLDCLLYASSCDNHSYNKDKKNFIQTESSRIKNAGF